MDKGNKISFIPQKPILKNTTASNRPASFAFIASVTIFFVTFATYGGVFLYATTLQKEVKAGVDEINAEKKALSSEAVIGEAERLRDVTRSVKKLIDNHIAVSAIFELLQDITLQSIVFNHFEASSGEETGDIGFPVRLHTGDTQKAGSAGDGVPVFSVTLSGRAPSYASLAYQSDVIKDEVKKGGRIKGFTISNISLDERGNVMFDLELLLEPSFLKYQSRVDLIDVLPPPQGEEGVIESRGGTDVKNTTVSERQELLNVNVVNLLKEGQ